MLHTLLAGVGAGFLFFISLVSENGGAFYFLVPLPLLLVGLGLGTRPAQLACFIGMCVAGLLTGFSGLLFFFIFIALPVVYFTHHALKWRGSERHREWYPMLTLLAHLTILIAFYFMMMSLATVDHGGLRALLPQGLGSGLKNTEPEVATMMGQITGELSFALFAGAGWIWVILIYAIAVLANSLLRLKEYALRPSLAIEPEGLPAWLLVLLILSGLIAMLGHGADRITAEMLFLILLLPYLLCGLAFVHQLSQRRGFAFRPIWLTCFYIVLIFTRWPLLAVIAIGLYRQLTEILDRRR